MGPRPSGKRIRCRSGRAVAGTICAYLDPKNSQRGWDPAKEKYWMPVDLYIGGAEHAVLHLLYSRFWHKFLYRPGLRQHQRAVPQADQPGNDPGRRRPEDEQVPRQRGQSRPGRRGVRCRLHAALRDVHGPAGSDQAVEHAGHAGCVPVPPEDLAPGRR